MARIRSIHPGLATDELFMSLTMAAKAFWPLLWTECDDQGVFEWKPIVLKARLFPADQVDMIALLEELLGLGAVMQFVFSGKKYGAVKNFCKYQRPKKPNAVHPTPQLVLEFTHSKLASIPTSSPPVPHQFPTSEEKSQQMEDGGWRMEDGGDKDKKPSPEAMTSDLFEDFWKACPRKVGKGATMIEFRKAIGLVGGQEVVDAMRRFATNQAKTELKFIPHPENWLKNQRWLDEFLKTEQPTSKKFAVAEGSPAWNAWVKHRGKAQPVVDIRTKNGIIRGWWFPTEFPQKTESAQ